jgi:hypothetical protein
MRTKCPKCGTQVVPPMRYTVLGPFWPFGQWQCQTCHSPLRFRLLSYHLYALLALLITAAYLLPFHLLGAGDSLWVLTAIPVLWAAVHWLSVRFATVDAAL